MYFRQSMTLNDFIQAIKSGSALPTGSESPYKLKEGIAAAMQSAGENGLEIELLSVSQTVNGGHWKGDTGQGYIGNLSCTIKQGNFTSFANLSVADVLVLRKNGNKAVFKAVQTQSKDGSKTYTNLRAVQGIVVDLNDAATVAILEGLPEFANQTANVTI